jgi:tRNA (guanine37-N1)-methyltransferase
MATPCVRVPRAAGEAARSRLDELGLLRRDRGIDATDTALFIPVTDPERAVAELPAALDADPDAVTRAERDLPEREGRTRPADHLEFEPTYERLGDLILLAEPADRAERAADAVLASDVPARAVLNRASHVEGEERTRDWDVVRVADADGGDGPEPTDATDRAGAQATRPPTETVHREYGHEYVVDVAAAYFSPRLATERRLVTEQVEPGEFAVDMFAGVGPFAIPMAARGADVVAADVNPDAIELLRDNAARNGVAERVTALERDARELVPEYADRAERIVMNLPHSADAFLDTAVALASATCVLHYYDIQSADAPYAPGEAAIREAARGYDVTIAARRAVRSYAPGVTNVRLDARLVRND